MKKTDFIERLAGMLAVCALMLALSACAGAGTGRGAAETTGSAAAGTSSDSGTGTGAQSSSAAAQESTASETGVTTDTAATSSETETVSDKPFDPDTTGSSVMPQKAPEDLSLGYRATLAENGGWTYFISDVRYGDGDYQMVCRDDVSGNTEVLYSLAQTDEYVMSTEYVEGSLEQSGGRLLYFSVENGQTLHESLFCFDTVTSRFNSVLSEPCSNMAIFYDAPADIAGLGWVLYGDLILPIKLSDASSYEGMAKGIEDLGDMSDISYSFFFSSAADEYKYSILDALPGGILQIQVVTFSPSAEKESRVTYKYDCVKQTLKKAG